MGEGNIVCVPEGVRVLGEGGRKSCQGEYVWEYIMKGGGGDHVSIGGWWGEWGFWK